MPGGGHSEAQATLYEKLRVIATLLTALPEK
jgi:hypothetical protein